MSERKRVKVYAVTLEIPEEDFKAFRRWTLKKTPFVYSIIQITKSERFAD